MVSLLSHHIYLLCAPRVFLRRLVGSLCGGCDCSWCCLEVRVRLNCLCGACNTCSTLGGLLSSVPVESFLQCFWGVRWSLQVFFWLCPFFFVLYGWRICIVVWYVLFNVFQLLLTRKVRLLVDGCWWWALVICLSHGRASWRDFLYCVHVVVYEELISWGAKR